MGGESISSAIAACALDALAIGIIITDSRAHRLYANAAASRMLDKPAGALRCCSAGKLSTACHDTRSSLHALISGACADFIESRRDPATRHLAAGAFLNSNVVSPARNYIRLAAPDRGGPDLAVCVIPMASAGNIPLGNAVASGTHAMILVRPIERTCNLEVEAQCLLGLSKAEARLASGLTAGLSLQEAAAAQAVTLATARSHLKSIFRKTGLNRQSQVVALLRSAQIPVDVAHQATWPRSNTAKGETKPQAA